MSFFLRRRTRLEQRRNPVLTLNRPTILLACICLLRIHTNFPDRLISVVLLHSFPDIPLLPGDVSLFFEHTCVNRPHWVREMGLMDNDDGIFQGTIHILSTGVLADVRLFPLTARERERGTGLGYIAALIGCESWRA